MALLLPLFPELRKLLLVLLFLRGGVLRLLRLFLYEFVGLRLLLLDG